MNARTQGALALAALVLGSALFGCSMIGKPGMKELQPTATIEPSKPKFDAPVATHRFEVSPDTDIVGAIQVTVSSKEDTLPDIARRFNVGYEEIVRANPGVDPWLPGAGKEIVVPTQFILPNAPREGVIINVAAMRIFYFPPHKPDEPQLLYTHPIGIGKVGWKTPEGVTKIISRQKDPTWRPSAAVRKEHAENGDPIPAVVGPGPDNPLGKYKFNLGWPSYLIHGTNKPYGVGLRSSHGCIRLYPEDIEKFFEMIPVGTQVRVVNQPFLFGWFDDRLHLQAYGQLEDDPRDWKNAQKKLLSKSLAQRIQKQLKDRGEEVDWERVSMLAHEPRGLPIAISAGGLSLDEELRVASRVENRIPDGANWDGADESSGELAHDADKKQDAQQMVQERDPQAPIVAPRTQKLPQG